MSTESGRTAKDDLAELRRATPCEVCGRAGSGVPCDGCGRRVCVDSAPCHQAHHKASRNGSTSTDRKADWRGWSRS